MTFTLAPILCMGETKGKFTKLKHINSFLGLILNKG